MAQPGGGDLPRFVISKVDDAARTQEAELPQQQQPSGGTDDTEARSTDTPVNGNFNTQLRRFATAASRGICLS